MSDDTPNQPPRSRRLNEPVVFEPGALDDYEPRRFLPAPRRQSRPPQEQFNMRVPDGFRALFEQTARELAVREERPITHGELAMRALLVLRVKMAEDDLRKAERPVAVRKLRKRDFER